MTALQALAKRRLRFRWRPEDDSLPVTETLARPHRTFNWKPYAYILPALILLAGVYLIPLLDAVRYSFTNARLVSGRGAWVGIDNYLALINSEFGIVLLRTGVWLVLSVAGSLIVGIIMALILDRPIPGRAFFRVIFTLPWIFPDAIAATMWKFALHPGWGLINSMLIKSGMTEAPINFFSTDNAFWSVIAVRIWKGAPFIFLAVLAGLQAIPREMDEAAYVDGATPWQRLIYVKLPMLKPVLWASGTILAAWTLVIFDLVFVLTGGGPMGSTEILSMTIYDAGFSDGRIGLASALSVVAIGLVAIFSYFYVRREIRAGVV
jgi:multiple sugar transport system permease protein